MSVAEGPKADGIIARVTNLLLRPSDEWDVIAAEQATVQGLYTTYIMVMAAIAPVAFLIGHAWHPILGSMAAAIAYGLSLGVVYLAAIVVDALAPNFGGQKDPILALKLVAYSMTPYWLGGVLYLVSGLFWPLSSLAGLSPLFGLYSLFLIYLGAPKLMKSPPDQSLIFSIVVMVVVGVAMSISDGLLWRGRWWY